jgi:hypothetical protein
MIVHFSLLICLGLFAALELFYLRKTDSCKLFVFFSAILFIMSFVRWEVGGDWNYYYSLFKKSDSWFVKSEFEWGFARINEFIKIIFNNYTLLLFLLAVILFFFQSKALSLFSPYPLTSLFILSGILFGNIFFVRQTIATMILLYSIHFIKKKKAVLFMTMVVLAMLFHRTAIIFIFVWWVYDLKIKSNQFILGVLISIAAGFLVLQLFMLTANIMGGTIEEKILIYTSNRLNTFGSIPSYTEIIIRGFVNKIFIFSSLLYFRSKIKIYKLEYEGYLNIYWVGLLIYFSTIFISLPFTRLANPYDIVFIILIPIVLLNLENLHYKISVFFVLSVYLFIRLFFLLNRGVSGNVYIPYKTIFSV